METFKTDSLSNFQQYFFLCATVPKNLAVWWPKLSQKYAFSHTPIASLPSYDRTFKLLSRLS